MYFAAILSPENVSDGSDFHFVLWRTKCADLLKLGLYAKWNVETHNSSLAHLVTERTDPRTDPKTSCTPVVRRRHNTTLLGSQLHANMHPNSIQIPLWAMSVNQCRVSEQLALLWHWRERLGVLLSYVL